MNAITINLNDDELKEIDRLSKDSGETREGFILSLLKNFLSENFIDDLGEEELAQDLVDAKKILEDIHAGKEKVYLAEDVWKELGI